MINASVSLSQTTDQSRCSSFVPYQWSALHHQYIAQCSKMQKRAILGEINGFEIFGMVHYQSSLGRHVSFSSPPFHPSMQHPKFYTLSISSMILHFYHFLTCLIIPWISSCTISNSISQNVISSQPFHPHLKCLPFHPCIFHPRMTRIGWKSRVEYANMKLLG